MKLVYHILPEWYGCALDWILIVGRENGNEARVGELVTQSGHAAVP